MNRGPYLQAVLLLVSLLGLESALAKGTATAALTTEHAAVTLLAEWPGADAVATDISPEALAVAGRR